MTDEHEPRGDAAEDAGEPSPDGPDAAARDEPDTPPDTNGVGSAFSEAPTQIGGTDATEGATGAVDGGAGTWPGASVRLAERYELEEPIGSGGAAIVWRAFDHGLSRSVAIKLLHPHLATDEVTVERFRLESVNAARLSHPSVVQIYDTGRQDDIVFLVMEHVDGPSLQAVLERRGRLDPEVAAALGEQVASALGEAHRQDVVHRDIKPANILLSSDGVAKVTDFGIAKALSGTQEALTNPGTVIGTAAYVAPEQLEGDAVDAGADVYALGVVLYECLTGEPAFRGDTPTATAAARLTQNVLSPRQVRADVPRELDEVVIRATRRDAVDRYPDGDAMAAALAQTVTAKPSDLTAALVDGGPAPAPTPPESQPPSEPPEPDDGRLGRVLLAVAGAVVLAAVAFLAGRGLQDAPSGPAGPTQPAGEALPIIRASDYDPYASPPDDEHPGEVPLAHDDDPSTAWTTETYRNDPAFGQLKPGVGVWFDLGQQRAVSSVVLDLTRAGVDVQIYAADQPHELPVDWGPPLAEQAQTSEVTEIRLPDETTARYWLVWITRLAPAGEGTYDAGLAEVRLFSP